MRAEEMAAVLADHSLLGYSTNAGNGPLELFCTCKAAVSEDIGLYGLPDAEIRVAERNLYARHLASVLQVAVNSTATLLELSELKARSVVLDFALDAWQLRRGIWYSTQPDREPKDTYELARDQGPLKTISRDPMRQRALEGDV